MNTVGIKMVVASTNPQYTDQLNRLYLGHRGQTVFQVLEHLRTWYKVSHHEKLVAEERFMAPWNETPEAYVTTFGTQLKECQIECDDLE